MDNNEQDFINEDDDPIDFSEVSTMNNGFMPHWPAEKLDEYYKSRKLTLGQMKGILLSEKEKFKSIPEVEKSKFLEGGKIDPNVIPKDFNERLAKMFPEFRDLPLKEFIEKINKNTSKLRNKHNKKYVFEIKDSYLSCDGRSTLITYKQIEKFYNALSMFMSPKKALKKTIKHITKRIIKITPNFDH